MSEQTLVERLRNPTATNAGFWTGRNGLFDNAAARIEALEAIVEKHSRTVDGVPLETALPVFISENLGAFCAQYGANVLRWNSDWVWVTDSVGAENKHRIADCYSTRAAAEQAKEGATKCST